MMHLDSHQHFWNYNPAHQVWMTDEMAVLRRDYLPEELKPLLKAIQFDGTIAVQARQMVEETEWLLELSDKHDFIKGVVGWVDLRSPELREQLEMYAKHPKLVGVRHVVHDEPDDHFMLLPEFRRGLAQLREFGLTYDLLLFPKHLPVAVKLVAEFPDQPFVLDHIAKPGIREGQVSPWREDLEAAGGVSECVLQTLRPGHRGEMEAVAARGFSPLPRHRHRDLRHRPRDDRLRLAGLHAVGRLRFHDAHRH